MNLGQFVKSPLEPIKNFAERFLMLVREHDSSMAEALEKRDVQIGLFYYSDRLTVGRFRVDFCKESYDANYHQYDVYTPGGLISFSSERLAIEYLAYEYVTHHKPL